MNTFKNFHPLTLACYYLFMFLISMFTFNPVYLCSGFIGALLFVDLNREGKFSFKSLIGYFILFLLISITNPLFSHNGATSLFFINDNRITLEALVFGMSLGLMIIEVLFLFKSFNMVFSSEKLIYFFGKRFPKLGLIISMSLNFVPKFVKSFNDVYAQQRYFSRGQGRVKSYLSSFSVVITQSLENSITLSDSMKARGYGLKKRSFYNNFKFTLYDGCYLIIMFVLFILSALGILLKSTEITFYPYICISGFNYLAVISYISFLILSLLPFLFQVKEGLKWKYSISKI